MAKQTYSGCAFYPSLGEEVVAGTISFSSNSLFFFGESGKIEIPLHRLQIRLDKTSGRIFFNDSQQSSGNIFTDESEIFKHRAFTHIPELRQQVIRVTGVKNAWIKLIVATGCFCAAFLLVAGIVFWGGGFVLRFLVNKVPTNYESDIGAKFVKQLKARRLLADDAKSVASLQAMGKRLLPKDAKSKFKFEFYIIKAPEPNAFAAPGGKIFVTEGAIQILTREELAGVLSHEITHVIKRHALRQIISSLGTYAALKLLLHGDSAFQSAVGDASEMLFSSGFSQAMENEADDGGWNYLVAADIDPRCLPNSLRKLEEEKLRVGDRGGPSKLFSTHPLTSERLKRFEKKWIELPKKTGFVGLSNNVPQIPVQ